MIVVLPVFVLLIVIGVLYEHTKARQLEGTMPRPVFDWAIATASLRAALASFWFLPSIAFVCVLSTSFPATWWRGAYEIATDRGMAILVERKWDVLLGYALALLSTIGTGVFWMKARKISQHPLVMALQSPLTIETVVPFHKRGRRGGVLALRFVRTDGTSFEVLSGRAESTQELRAYLSHAPFDAAVGLW